MRSCSIKNPISDNNKKTSTSDEVIRREAADALAREAKKNGLISKSSGTVSAESSGSFFASVYSKRGEKGVNQDCFVVWEEFGFQEDLMFCGVFDGHGSWGHFVAKRVRELLPSFLLCDWQEVLSMNSLVSGIEEEIEVEKKSTQFDVWKESYLRTCTAVDKELKRHCGLDSFYSGTTALMIVKQVWDVIPNEEAVQIVASAPDRGKAAKRLVECANRAWKRKRHGIAVDDCSAVCLFFH
ncbi:putative protein phosphatase 2C 73 [Acorus calamus]|uniref:protein-serine/threonine phosphatase n=1 Tax=Acorus calamus TaxID=4465 RepID=A0AAV9EQA3_ACOCL|nr:putative protein phosphatase 2C 73 [Acorus calamus]